MKTTRFDARETAQQIKEGKSFIVACHRSPDGDALGSMLGLYLAIKGCGKEVYAYCIDEVPGKYSFLPACENIIHDHEALPEKATLICVDCAEKNMLGEHKDAVFAGRRCINIDHHGTNSCYGDVNFVDGKGASCCELVYDVAECLGEITPEIADCLYLGLITDTGSFAYDYTRPKTLRAAANVMERGASFEKINFRVFRERTLEKTRLLATVLSSLEMLEEGRIAILRADQCDFAACGASTIDLEGIVNYGVEIQGVQISLLFAQKADGSYKVSLRAGTDSRVDNIAVSLGGGGHAKAAGCTLEGPFEQAKEKVLRAIKNEWRA